MAADLSAEAAAEAIPASVAGSDSAPLTTAAPAMLPAVSAANPPAVSSVFVVLLRSRTPNPVILVCTTIGAAGPTFRLDPQMRMGRGALLQPHVLPTLAFSENGIAGPTRDGVLPHLSPVLLRGMQPGTASQTRQKEAPEGAAAWCTCQGSRPTVVDSECFRWSWRELLRERTCHSHGTGGGSRGSRAFQWPQAVVRASLNSPQHLAAVASLSFCVAVTEMRTSPQRISSKP